ncbi:DE-cadherin [Rhynchophorus ferrugineus]|uniref:DE-cadherin n=1 Tax=Rhynchophorus ferrugineus TaxID=354439 RepID=UPI003FCD48B2
MKMGRYFGVFLLILLTIYSKRSASQHLSLSDGEDASSDYSSSKSQIQQNKTTDDNKKPMFVNCSETTVKEEQVAGTFVTQVKAEDNDSLEAGGTITYKLVKREGGRDYYSIDNETGVVRTTMPFDRDEPFRQKEMFLTVQATDNGRPPLSDICSFKVTVTDINDNAPQLDQQVYSAQVAEDLKPNSEVMRIFAYDIDDGVNSKLTYSFVDSSVEFLQYFRIDADTGVVYLQQSLLSKRDTKFSTIVNVRDNGQIPLDTEANVSITVVGSDKQPPRIKSRVPEGDIILKENYSNYQEHLITIVAESSINDKEVAFELIKGKTMQTNREQTFVLIPSSENDNTAYISLARALDYETVTEYTLSVRIKNKDLMDTSINIPIKIEDVNDEFPNFIELIKGSVVENDAPGVQAMVVRAIDKDGTSANNIVRYELLSHTESFEIDESSGVIKSRVKFDRENTSVYHVKVRAYDNSPSSLTSNGKPNEAVQTFQISIEDRNDNPPKFTESLFQFSNILENTDIGKDVGEVQAKDKDSASLITYSIIDGNIDDAFSIENTTGRIKVNKKLDYEKIEKYTLKVRAFDGIYEDTAMVSIFIGNVNDERPVFEDHEREIRIEEEKIPKDCLITVKAYDPDIKDRKADQLIVYGVSDNFLKVDKNGCVKLTKPLDRDRPFGSPSRQAYIYAYDSSSMTAGTEIMILLDDINDNAPFLNVTIVVWYENQDVTSNSLFITHLSADDYDGPDNGPPFTYKLSEIASNDIVNKFKIENGDLYALVSFDREEQKYYDIPILVTDSGNPQQSSVSILRVIIGDRNDNPAKDGESEIFVYKYEKLNKDIVIGRVFVDDPDDWDLPDKVFVQLDNYDYFRLSSDDPGMIVMYNNIPEGKYSLQFNVTEENEPIIPKHTVSANVAVTVKGIPKVAVVKSGSIRIEGITMEDFVQKTNGVSKKDLLHKHISEIVNTSIANVDVFSVLQSPSNSSLVDVRFSAHGSPYYAAEKLNNKLTDYQEKLEKELNVRFVTISINECLNETICGLGNSCSNKLNIYDDPAVVFTNQTSFVGVKAYVQADCNCADRIPVECFNGGTMESNGVCICPSEFEGPYCERLSIGFNGDGWAMYPGLDACNSSHITLSVSPASDDGLIFYAGPLNYRHAQLSKDYISLELNSGSALLKIDNGFGPKDIEIAKKLNDGATHKIRISYIYTKTDTIIEMEIDDCKSNCIKVTSITQGLLSINGPLQIGGKSKPFTLEQNKILWNSIAPTDVGFRGCIKNFTYNGVYYNLGEPSDQLHAFPNCNYALQQAVTFGIDSTFLVAILACIAILFILLLAVVVHRRQQDNLNEKDIDDTTENIINYEDEGGGECDANYDLSVFSKTIKDPLQGKDNSDINTTEPPIHIFLDNKKENCDKDPENLPYDDVRHYAYEGDSNSIGSLSSLGSCTDDGDLDFNYLFSFGKRFSKLADMYDNDGSDDDTQNGGNEAWC